MRPCSIVQPLEGKYKGLAGRVEAWKEPIKDGVPAALITKMEPSGDLVELDPAKVRVLVNH